MFRQLVLVLTCLAATVAGFSASFVARKPLLSRREKQKFGQHRSSPTAQRLYMRDASASYWFQVGDSVRVVADDVFKAGVNLENRVGTVVETWEKCDVDPTCCCAEQVDINMAVRVEFPGTEVDPTVVGTSFMHYFAEEELWKEKKNQPEETSTASSSLPCDEMNRVAFKMNHLRSSSQLFSSWEPEDSTSDDTNNEASPAVPFDGMSCVAFKMNHLQSASQQPRGLASWEPAAVTSEESKLEDTTTTANTNNEADQVPFDGMSCVAFKMDHLQSASQKPRGIAAWEPSAAVALEESQSEETTTETDTNNEVSPVLFDGMSCVAFKMDHLQSASQQPRGIAAWEPAAAATSEDSKLEETTTTSNTSNQADPVPFDGMSCVAFKMDHLQCASQKPRGIAAWEPVSPINISEQEQR